MKTVLLFTPPIVIFAALFVVIVFLLIVWLTIRAAFLESLSIYRLCRDGMRRPKKQAFVTRTGRIAVMQIKQREEA